MRPTVKKLFKECQKLVEEFPDFIYSRTDSAATSCSNTLGGDERYPDNSGCIIGQAYKRLTGVDVPGGYDDACVADLAGGNLLANGKSTTKTKMYLDKLAILQVWQDRGEKWVDSMNAAELFSD